MGDNILGKNIKHMRALHGETLEELGNVIRASKSTVQGYEIGRRMPDIATTALISQHYGKTVDEMVHNKLYELEQFDSSEIVNVDEMLNIFFHILPIIETEEACKNEFFLNGITNLKNMLKAFRNNEEVDGLIISETIDLFDKAAKTNIIEAVANTLWCIFFTWTQQYTDLERLKKLQTRMYNGETDWKELQYEHQKNNKKSAPKKQAFIHDFDKLIFDLIHELKTTKRWSQLGDYYLALRYMYGLIDTDYSDEMNQAVGIQMMLAFLQIGNKYALDFFTAIIK